MIRLLSLFLAASATPVLPTGEGVGPSDETGYWLYAAAESADEVYMIRFDGRDAEVVQRVEVGYQATEIEGPHGLTVSPDGRHWFLSMAHGNPYGILYKDSTGDNRLVGQCELGLFPATMEISPATGLLYVVNFDLHGDMTPSSVSIVDPDEVVEVAQTTTGAMPHGSRVSPDGLKHYSCAMMSDELYELDAATFEVERVLKLLPEGVEDAAHGHGDKEPDDEDEEGRAEDVEHGHGLAKPTWVHPHPTLARAYVCLNALDQVAIVDLDAWEVIDRLPTGVGPYNTVVTPDGKRLIVTYKGTGAVGIWDLETGRERARIPTSRRVTHGVVVSPDSRYAFVTNEGKGSEQGTLDVFDLATDRKIETLELGLQMGGLAFWRQVP